MVFKIYFLFCLNNAYLDIQFKIKTHYVCRIIVIAYNFISEVLHNSFLFFITLIIAFFLIGLMLNTNNKTFSLL